MYIVYGKLRPYVEYTYLIFNFKYVNKSRAVMSQSDDSLATCYCHIVYSDFSGTRIYTSRSTVV